MQTLCTGHRNQKSYQKLFVHVPIGRTLCPLLSTQSYAIFSRDGTSLDLRILKALHHYRCDKNFTAHLSGLKMHCQTKSATLAKTKRGIENAFVLTFNPGSGCSRLAGTAVDHGRNIAQLIVL